MQEVQLEAGTLPPPACYATEQERFEAYVAAITATITGGIQWEVGTVAPTDLTAYWLRVDSNGRPVEALKWSTTDGIWLRWFSGMVFGTEVGTADVYAMNPLPVFTANTAYRAGSAYTFIAVNANTGASTFNVNGLGAKAIKKNVSDALAAGDIKAGQAVTLIYDGTNFQIASKTSELNTHGSSFITSTGAGTFTVPSNVTSIVVECVGGGGGGDLNAAATSGGGGGGYSYKRWTVTPGAALPYVVGTGGNRATSAGNDVSGADTTFNTTQIGNGGVKASGGGAGGSFAGSDFGIQGSSGARRTAGDRYMGGIAAFAGSQAGWSLTGVIAYTNGILGGGGASDLDTGSNEASSGGSGCILITW